MHRELKQLSLILGMGFLLVALSSAYWGLFTADGILAREDNPRKVQAEHQLQRGQIFDRNGIILAEGTQEERSYPYTGMEAAIGYYDFQFGASSLEAAFDDILRGDVGETDTWREFENSLFHRDKIGFDLRSTLDLTIQQTLHDNLGDYLGAGVVIYVPSGDIVAMVSQPGFDPHNIEPYLDENGEPIHENTPLFNRVRQGGYQPGSLIELILLAGLYNAETPSQMPFSNGTQPLDVSMFDLPVDILTCLVDPQTTQSLTLEELFVYGCPTHFVLALGDLLPLNGYQSFLKEAGFLEAPPVHRLDTDIAATPIPLTDTSLPDELTLTAIGQSDFVINILQMARFVAAIANQGNAPVLHLADAYRLPDSEEWITLDIPRRQPAILRQDVALQLRQALLFAAQRSPLVQIAQRTDFAIRDYKLHAQVGVAYAGEPLVWFVGFLELQDGTSLAIVVVVEGTTDPRIVAEIAGNTLQSAILTLEKSQ